MKILSQFKNWILANVENRYVGNVLAWLGLLYWPFDEKLPLREAIYKAWRRPLSGKVGWLHVFGGVALFLLFILVTTGLLLSFHYEPDPETGRQSVLTIATEINGGWLLRGVHRWAGQLTIVLVLVHVTRTFFARAYRAPRQANWVIGVVILPVIIGFQFTGELLPWDQTAYWSAVRGMELGAAMPAVGPLLSHLSTGAELTNVSLVRYFALHAVLLPWILFFLLAFHLRLVRRHGISPAVYRKPTPGTTDLALVVVLKSGATPEEIAAVEESLRGKGATARVLSGKQKVLIHTEHCSRQLIDQLALDPRVDEIVPVSEAARGTAFFPYHFFRILSAMVITGGLLIMLAAFFPPELAGPFDPFRRPEGLATKWYFAWFEQFLLLLPPGFSFVASLAFLAVPVVGLFWPLLDRYDENGPKRPWLTPVVGAIGAVAFFFLTLRGVLAS